MKVEHRDWDLFLKIAESPFKRPDMKPEEFEEELMYLGEHYEECKNGTYIVDYGEEPISMDKVADNEYAHAY